MSTGRGVLTVWRVIGNYFFGGAGRGQRVMWYLVSFVLLFIGCVLCCAGELWAVVLYLPFMVGMVCNDIEQSR
jgi:hypothetical protein